MCDQLFVTCWLQICLEWILRGWIYLLFAGVFDRNALITSCAVLYSIRFKCSLGCSSVIVWNFLLSMVQIMTIDSFPVTHGFLFYALFPRFLNKIQIHKTIEGKTRSLLINLNKFKGFFFFFWLRGQWKAGVCRQGWICLIKLLNFTSVTKFLRA